MKSNRTEDEIFWNSLFLKQSFNKASHNYPLYLFQFSIHSILSVTKNKSCPRYQTILFPLHHPKASIFGWNIYGGCSQRCRPTYVTLKEYHMLSTDYHKTGILKWWQPPNEDHCLLSKEKKLKILKKKGKNQSLGKLIRFPHQNPSSFWDTPDFAEIPTITHFVILQSKKHTHFNSI